MKGFAEEYIFAMVVVIVFILVSIGILLKLRIINISETGSNVADVRYACAQYNNSAIGLENFRTVLYGFLTDQCGSMNALAEERIGMNDIRNAVDQVDKNVEIIKISECKLPFAETHTLYYCCNDTIEKNSNIQLIRKAVRKSNVLLCIT